MKFTSIKDLVERVPLNAKAAECLGLSGSLSNLGEDLNELEASEYLKSLMVYSREFKKFEERKLKVDELSDKKEEDFRQKLDERTKKQQEAQEKYQLKLDEYNKKLAEVRTTNLERASTEKKLLNEPKKPNEPKPLREVTIPKIIQLEPPVEPIKQRIMFSQRDRVRNEREMLHLYLSGHPLDEVQKRDDVISIKDLTEIESGDSCIIQGVLQSLKVTNTRKKTLMARLRIEDKTSSIEVVAFPKLYESLKSNLIEGELYEILGRVDITKKYSDETEEESTHIQIIGKRVQAIHVGQDKEWEIIYPLLKGKIRILPGIENRSKSSALKILNNLSRSKIEENLG